MSAKKEKAKRRAEQRDLKIERQNEQTMRDDHDKFLRAAYLNRNRSPGFVKALTTIAAAGVLTVDPAACYK